MSEKITVARFKGYDAKEYGEPWIAPIGTNGRPNFGIVCGGYTGGKGEAGELYVIDPAELEICVCVQKNYKDESKSVVIYRIYHEGKMKNISPENARKMALRRRPSERKNMVMIRNALHGVDLTEEELQAIKCLSKLESDKVKNIISAFVKMKMEQIRKETENA